MFNVHNFDLIIDHISIYILVLHCDLIYFYIHLQCPLRTLQLVLMLTKHLNKIWSLATKQFILCGLLYFIPGVQALFNSLPHLYRCRTQSKSSIVQCTANCSLLNSSHCSELRVTSLMELLLIAGSK